MLFGIFKISWKYKRLNDLKLIHTKKYNLDEIVLCIRYYFTITLMTKNYLKKKRIKN